MHSVVNAGRRLFALRVPVEVLGLDKTLMQYFLTLFKLKSVMMQQNLW